MKKEKQISINIVGSGLAGLFSGALLAKHGFKVSIFEAQNKPGGYATSWKRKNFLFDSSLHEINGFVNDTRKEDIFNFLDLFNKIKLIKIPSCYTSLFNDDSFKVPHNYETFIKDLVKKFPEEEKNIKKVLEIIKKISIHAVEYIKSGANIKDVPTKHPILLRYFFSTVHSLIWKKIKNPKLRTIIAQMINYHSDNVKKMNLIYFAVPTFSFISEAFWISGTSFSLTSALKEIIEENGGKIYLKSKVTKIIFKDKKAISVVVNNKETFESDITICNSSLISTVKDLIDKKDFPKILRVKALKTVPSTSIFSIYLGMNIETKKLGLTEFCYMINNMDDIKHIINKGKLVDFPKRPVVIANFNLDNSLCPKGKSVVNVCTIDNIAHWEKIKHNKKEYDKEKQRVAEILLDKIEQHFPGFKKHIEVMEIGTPLTMEKYTGNTDGAVYGACQRTMQGNIFRFPNEIKDKNLYFTSAWVSPGGGITGVINSALQTTEKILSKYNIKNNI